MNRLGSSVAEGLIVLDPDRPSFAEARTEEGWIHVWAIVGYLKMFDWNVEQVAQDYRISRETVQAALDFYNEHRETIDDRLRANEPLEDR